MEDMPSKLCSEGNFPTVKCRRFELQILERATQNFSRVLGLGGFAVVYFGELEDGTKVAVKRMRELAREPATASTTCSVLDSGELQIRQDQLQRRKILLKSFESEAETLPQLRHRNIITSLSCCMEGDERILVYEYMPHGNLEHHILQYRNLSLRPLDWMQRLRIALDVAQALEYLHNLVDNKKYIHRDVKPANILLDENLRAKLCDFGLVRATAEGESSVITMVPAGTPCHCAPEVFFYPALIITPQMDVYSVGIVLIVLVTGKGVQSVHGDFVTWFEAMYRSQDDFIEGIDPVLEGPDRNFQSPKLLSISDVAKLALFCTVQRPCSRPTMASVVSLLTSLLEESKATGVSGHEGIRNFRPANQSPQNLKSRSSERLEGLVSMVGTIARQIFGQDPIIKISMVLCFFLFIYLLSSAVVLSAPGLPLTMLISSLTVSVFLGTSGLVICTHMYKVYLK